MHLLKAQKGTTSSSCPKDSMERTGSSSGPTSDLSWGHTRWHKVLALDEVTKQNQKDGAVLQKRCDC